MSINSNSASKCPAILCREYERQILRYALGVFIPILVMVMFQWEMAYITPTLVTLLLSPNARPLSLRSHLMLGRTMLFSLAIGLILVRLVEPFPLVTIIIMGGLLYGIFYKAAHGTNLLTTVLLLMSVLTYPSLAMLDIQLSMETALGVCLAYSLAMLSSAIMYLLIPPNTLINNQSSEAQPAAHSNANRVALLTTVIVLPLLVFFLMFDHQAAMLTLIYVGILAPNVSLTKGLRSCIGILLANAMGGVLAIVIYELLVLVPMSSFYLLLMFLVAISFAKKVFTSPQGALYASAFSCLLLLITDLTNTTGINMDLAFYERWLYIALANLYVILSFMFFTALGWLRTNA
ncbi:DUF2955 domain-containing protein [Agarivorans sp. OAG1]|uniref:DUF2955 domain-containing protein n=1 Tax=Agarivorans sp. OAG1 TaxID=3082387 RepID=UPI0030D41B25